MGLRQINYPWLSDVIATTDATPTVSAACSVTMATGTSGFVDINYIAMSTTLVVTGKVRYPIRNVAGTLTLLTIISQIAIAGDAALLTAIADATKSGTTFQPRVTGIVATNLTWQLDCRYSLQ